MLGLRARGIDVSVDGFELKQLVVEPAGRVGVNDGQVSPEQIGVLLGVIVVMGVQP